MNKKSGTSKDAADKLVRGIKRKIRKQYSAEEKSGLSCLACGAKRALPHYAAAWV